MASAPNTDLVLVGPVKRGRPSIHTPELAADICRRIMEGETLSHICMDDDMPARSTVCEWLMRDYHGFSGQYAQAREYQGDFEFDEIIDISDDTQGDAYIEMTDAGPVAKLDGDAIQRAKLRVETRKWRAERLNRRVYGNSVKHEHELTLHPAAGAQRVPPSLDWLAGQLPGGAAAGGREPDTGGVG